jgi:hypothetical protein
MAGTGSSSSRRRRTYCSSCSSKASSTGSGRELKSQADENSFKASK